jgi:hypothetical protein
MGAAEVADMKLSQKLSIGLQCQIILVSARTSRLILDERAVASLVREMA